MIDEERQDLAADYALNELDPYKAGAFEAELARDPELRALTEELCEAVASPRTMRRAVFPRRNCASASWVRCPRRSQHLPLPLRPSRRRRRPSERGVSILPWPRRHADHHGCALVRARPTARGFDELATGGEYPSGENAGLKGRIADLSKEVDLLKNRDALAQVRLATLSAQVDAYKNGKVLIAWDPEKQRGVVQFTNLPHPDAGKDYQLWIIDPKYPKPVSGGVVPTNPDGSANIAFKTVEPIEKADKFAVSVEPAGGVPSATGPIVFLGN